MKNRLHSLQVYDIIRSSNRKGLIIIMKKEDDNNQEFRDRQIIKYSHSVVILDRLKELIEKEFGI